MKITFVTDHQSPASGNEFYVAGTQADLRKGQALVDLGVALEGWVEQNQAEVSTDGESWTDVSGPVGSSLPIELSNLKKTELIELAKERGISYSGLLKADLIAALESE